MKEKELVDKFLMENTHENRKKSTLGKGVAGSGSWLLVNGEWFAGNSLPTIYSELSIFNVQLTYGPRGGGP
jgi:hypothetical protein